MIGLEGNPGASDSRLAREFEDDVISEGVSLRTDCSAAVAPVIQQERPSSALEDLAFD
jgi:hypothetical protein